ncbi:glycoside hydrolase family 28 protein [Segetibacter sp. 3557_3]|uniref:glycoside hydrolase family 28 protein n=1 Tax=Segetibacter sp. 3557_3 TaxID=2547429 RepID=UPI001A9F5895|nr:glycosyl hydrolase family 28 protein [Segetibacter sp. 3557_3]
MIALLVTNLNAQSQDYIITGFGVSSDSTVLHTRQIQQAIDKAEADGGGTIVVPRGVFLTGALFFKPKTGLRLMEGAVLKGSDDIAQYPLIPSRMEGRSIYYYAALVNAYHVDSFSITGPGTIDGNGLRYWQAFWAYRDSMRKLGKEATNLEVHRPRLLFIWGSDHVKIQNTKLRNSGFWTTHLYQCNDVLIENCDIRSPYKPVPAPSTDGIDIDVCKRVTVRGCYISVNDDAVCIKGGKGPDAHRQPENGIVEDILIENCTFGESHGTLTLGSESIHARNITLRNCKVENNAPLLRLKMRPDTYQTFENIRIENVTGKCGTIISMNPWRQFFSLGGSTEKPFATVRNITIANVMVTCNRIGELEGNPADTVDNILFRNIKATAATPTLKNNYQKVKAVDVFVNGQPLAIKKW